MLTAPAYIQKLRAYSPLSLFENGENGLWLDTSNIGSMQTAQAGTTNSYQNNDNIGNIRDRVFNRSFSRPSSIPVLKLVNSQYYAEYGASSRSLADDSPSTNTITQGARGLSFVISVLFANTGATQSAIFFTTSSSTTQRFGCEMNASNFLAFGGRTTNGGSNTNITGAVDRSGSVGVMSGTIDYTSGAMNLWWNHTLDATGTHGAPQVTDTTACNAIYPMGRITTNFMGSGSRIYQNLIINRVLSTSERMREVERQAKAAGVTF